MYTKSSIKAIPKKIRLCMYSRTQNGQLEAPTEPNIKNDKKKLKEPFHFVVPLCSLSLPLLRRCAARSGLFDFFLSRLRYYYDCKRQESVNENRMNAQQIFMHVVCKQQQKQNIFFYVISNLLKVGR